MTSFSHSLKHQDLLQTHTGPGNLQKDMRRNFARAWVAVASYTLAVEVGSRGTYIF